MCPWQARVPQGSPGLVRDSGSEAKPKYRHTLGALRSPNVCLCPGFSSDRRSLTGPDDSCGARARHEGTSSTGSHRRSVSKPCEWVPNRHRRKRGRPMIQRRSRQQDRHLRSKTPPRAPEGSILGPRTKDLASRGPRNLRSRGTPKAKIQIDPSPPKEKGTIGDIRVLLDLRLGRVR